MRHRITPVLAASAMVLSAAPANADLGDQLFKLLPDDGAQEDQFGFSVAISGDTAIVGTPSDDYDKDLYDSGSAYLFDTTTGQQLFKLLADDGASEEFFGKSVAIDGATAIVGAGAWGPGSAYLFDTNTGQQLFKLLPDDGGGGDNFGTAVGISGATAIVGASNGPGSAYLFDTNTGQQLFKLLPDDGAPGDSFGASVAISGATAIVGAYADDDNGITSGSAYLFDTTTGVQIAKLLAEDGAAGDAFGGSVAISGATAIVGAPNHEDNGDDSGAAYLFDIADPATPVQIAKLLPDDGASDDFFGLSVAISGGTAIVGARWDADNGTHSGSAYLFDVSDPQNPAQIAKLLADDGAAFDEFGRFVAISGATAIVGAPNDHNKNGFGSGSAYLFDAAASGTCPWDVNDDGVVNHHDIVEVVHNLGMCDDPDNCPWDVNGDGIVNGRDVAAVATHFGPCPKA